MRAASRPTDTLPGTSMWAPSASAAATPPPHCLAPRAIFGADDRIVPAPPGLLDPSAPTFRHEGRLWRIDRVEASSGVTVAALIDVESEELAAEARASADLIEVLGHELLNGLSLVSAGELIHQLMLRGQHHIAHAKHRVGTGGEHLNGLLS